MARPIRLVTVLAVLFLVAGCTSDDGAPTTTEAAPTTTLAATTVAPTTTTTEPPRPDRFDEIEDLIEVYLESWETKDEPALRAAVTDDFVINEYIYRAENGERFEFITDDSDGLVSEGFGYDWQNQIVGESVVTGDGPWIVRHREQWQQLAERQDGIATYTVVDDDGTLKIARHSWAGFAWYV